MHHEVMAGDGRRRELKRWASWFHEVGRARLAFAKAVGFDPMINETASMGVLASAASKAGLLAITEYVCRKRAVKNGRQFRHGRADLWVHDWKKDRSWAFEAKQVHGTGQMKFETLKRKLDAACRDAADIPHWEAKSRFGMLIVTVPAEGATSTTKEALETLATKCFAAFEVNGCAPAAYIFIARQKRPRVKKALLVVTALEVA